MSDSPVQSFTNKTPEGVLFEGFAYEFRTRSTGRNVAAFWDKHDQLLATAELNGTASVYLTAPRTAAYAGIIHEGGMIFGDFIAPVPNNILHAQ